MNLLKWIPDIFLIWVVYITSLLGMLIYFLLLTFGNKVLATEF